MSDRVEIDGFRLRLEDVLAVARPNASHSPEVTLSASAESRLREVRAVVDEQWLDPIAAGETTLSVYGFNTGVGVLKDRPVERARLDEFQELYIRSHCVGIGAPFPVDVVRAAMLVRANSLASGFSGVTPGLVQGLCALLNAQVTPVVPEIGSLGASGDLAPLAHVGAVLIGEPGARVWRDGGPVRLRDLPDSARPAPVRLGPKEAMALTNGTSFMLALLALAVADARELLELADVCAALSLEAMLGEQDAFDARLQAVRGHPGQEASARHMRSLLHGGEPTGERLRLEYLERKIAGELARQQAKLRAESIDPAALLRLRLATEHLPRVQDAYSIRCVPQVHGASRDALAHVGAVVERELNAVTDNPLLFGEGDGFRALSGGNFHGQPLALAADYAALALAEIGSISERRLFRLLDSELSYGLPSNLTGGEPGINTGLMLIQYTAAALVSENKTLCHPASSDSIPTSGDQEDHVSMGAWACRKARTVLENTRDILALELLGAAQGVDLQEQLLGRSRKLGRGVRAAHQAVRSAGVEPLKEDRYLEDDIRRMSALVRSPEILQRVRAAIDGERSA